MPRGEAAELTRRLRLGTRAAQSLLSRGPRPEWVAAVHAVQARELRTIRWPVDGGRLWRGLQRPRRGHPQHKGVDIGAPAGTSALAANDGLVVYSHNDVTGYGNMVMIVHADATVTFYAHLQAAYVTPGMHVRRAQVLGEIGTTGISHGTHLHFEWRVNGTPTDPLPHFVRIPGNTAARVRQVMNER